MVPHSSVPGRWIPQSTIDRVILALPSSRCCCNHSNACIACGLRSFTLASSISQITSPFSLPAGRSWNSAFAFASSTKACTHPAEGVSCTSSATHRQKSSAASSAPAFKRCTKAGVSRSPAGRIRSRNTSAVSLTRPPAATACACRTCGVPLSPLRLTNFANASTAFEPRPAPRTTYCSRATEHRGRLLRAQLGQRNARGASAQHHYRRQHLPLPRV